MHGEEYKMKISLSDHIHRKKDRNYWSVSFIIWLLMSEPYIIKGVRPFRNRKLIVFFCRYVFFKLIFVQKLSKSCKRLEETHYAH